MSFVRNQKSRKTLKILDSRLRGNDTVRGLLLCARFVSTLNTKEPKRLDSKMLEAGVIIKTDGATATVRIDKAQACSHCKSKCMESNGSMITEALNPIGANFGDIVSLKVNPKTALTATLIVFGLPLLALLAGVLIANRITDNQIYIMLVGFIMFLLTLIPVKIYDNHLKKGGVCSITITEILS